MVCKTSLIRENAKEIIGENILFLKTNSTLDDWLNFF